MHNQAVSKHGVTPTSYRIVTIPKFTGGETNDSPPHVLAHKFRDFRLLALKTSPGAFASTYDDESRRSLEHTLERLRSTKATQFVALEDGDSLEDFAVCEADMSDLLEHDWLGIVVLMGPNQDVKSISAKSEPLDQMAAQSDQAAEVEGHEALHFHLNGMFVVPRARGCGMGRRLIEASLEKARRMSGVSGMECTIIVDEWNHAARDLYAGCGFKVVATEVYGDNRIALRMELRLSADR